MRVAVAGILLISGVSGIVVAATDLWANTSPAAVQRRVLKELRDEIRRHPDRSRTRLELASVYFSLDRFEEAFDQYAALSEQPELAAQALFRMATARAAMNDHDGTLNYLRLAVRAGHRNPAEWRQEDTLRPLRGNEEFERLVWSLTTPRFPQNPPLRHPDGLGEPMPVWY